MADRLGDDGRGHHGAKEDALPALVEAGVHFVPVGI